MESAANWRWSNGDMPLAQRRHALGPTETCRWPNVVPIVAHRRLLTLAQRWPNGGPLAQSSDVGTPLAQRCANHGCQRGPNGEAAVGPTLGEWRCAICDDLRQIMTRYPDSTTTLAQRPHVGIVAVGTTTLAQRHLANVGQNAQNVQFALGQHILPTICQRRWRPCWKK